MNEITNIDTQEIMKAVESGDAVLKTSSNKGKIITGGIAVGLTAGAGLGGFFLGKHVERKKFEERLERLEEAMYGDEYYEEDEEESDEDDIEEEAPAPKKSKKASKKEEPEKVEGEVE